MLANTKSEKVRKRIEKILQEIAHYSAQDRKHYIAKVKQVEQLALEYQFFDHYTSALIKKGLYYYRNDKLDQAIMVTRKAADIATKFKYKKKLTHCYINLSGYLQQKNQLDKAISYNYEALKLNPDDFESAHLYNNLAMILHSRKENRRALDYLEQSIYYYKKIPEPRLAGVYINQGIILGELKNSDLVVKAYSKAINYARKEQDDFLLATALEGLGRTYLDLDELDQASHFLEKALIVANDLNELFLRGNIFNNLGAVYVKGGQLKTAITYFEDAFQLFEKHGHPNVGIKSLEMLHETHAQLGDWEQAYHYQKQLLAFKEKQFQESQEQTVNEIIQDKVKEIDLLQNKHELITRQNEELTQYAYIVAHDLKEPLRNINGFAHLIKKDTESELSENSIELLDFLINASVKMNDLLSDLLKYTTIDTGKDEREVTNLNELIASLKFDLQYLFKETAAELCTDELPSIGCYPLALRQLLQNLITNSIKFRHPERSCKMHLSYKKEGNTHIFTFTDNGIGIEPIYLQKIFRIFTRLEKHKYEGTGIGLAICKKVVDKHGGIIYADSDGKSGTSFTFTLVEDIDYFLP